MARSTSCSTTRRISRLRSPRRSARPGRAAPLLAGAGRRMHALPRAARKLGIEWSARSISTSPIPTRRIWSSSARRRRRTSTTSARRLRRYLDEGVVEAHRGKAIPLEAESDLRPRRRAEFGRRSRRPIRTVLEEKASPPQAGDAPAETGAEWQRMIYDEPIYRPLGDCYLAVEFGDEADLSLNFKVLALADRAEEGRDPRDHRDHPLLPRARSCSSTASRPTTRR